MTKEQFESRYASRSGVTEEFLHAHGREAMPCDCGEPDCEGWQMAHVEQAEATIPRWRTKDIDEHVQKKLAGYEAALRLLEGVATGLRNELTAAHQRIENIIEVAGHLQPADVRNAAFWIVAPPHLEDPRPEEWEIDARVSQRNREVDRVEKVIGLCLEKHFGQIRERIATLEAENERLKWELATPVMAPPLADSRRAELMAPPVVMRGWPDPLFVMESADID